MLFEDTIHALSTGRLPSGVAIIRISGPKTRFVLETICGDVPEPRVASLRNIGSASSGVLDKGVVLFFSTPSSFTGEDCAELHLHGGRAVVAAVLDCLSLLPGLRHAEAGEFTRRAFLNGKLDLVEAEGLADLISAETESQRRFAALASSGAQSVLYDGWRARIVHARAMIEAELDFADEGDVPGSVSDQVWADMTMLASEIDRYVSGHRRAEIIREGYRVVIVGATNAGKSSLLNALARRDVAIVSEEPGTTRDLLEVNLDLDGIKVVLTDTAGLRSSDNRVENMGMERALARARDADLVIELIAPDDPVSDGSRSAGAERLVIGSKNDLRRGGPGQTEGFDGLISIDDADSIRTLVELIKSRALSSGAQSGDLLPSRLRHVEFLRACSVGLHRACDPTDNMLELRAEELRHASDRLGRITGAVDVEDLLDSVFSEFCIGK